MNVEGFCRSCGKDFDAHWNCYPELSARDAILNPYCPYCKSKDVATTTDEAKDVDCPDIWATEEEE